MQEFPVPQNRGGGGPGGFGRAFLVFPAHGGKLCGMRDKRYGPGVKVSFLLGFLFLFCILYYQGKAAYKLFTAAMFLSLREMAFFAAYSLMGVGTWCTDILVHVFEKGWVGEGEFLTAVNGVANVSLF